MTLEVPLAGEADLTQLTPEQQGGDRRQVETSTGSDRSKGGSLLTSQPEPPPPNFESATAFRYRVIGTVLTKIFYFSLLSGCERYCQYFFLFFFLHQYSKNKISVTEEIFSPILKKSTLNIRPGYYDRIIKNPYCTITSIDKVSGALCIVDKLACLIRMLKKAVYYM